MASTEKTIAVVCAVNNVWTSCGKITDGQRVSLPSGEARGMIKEGLVKAIKATKGKTNVQS